MEIIQQIRIVVLLLYYYFNQFINRL